MQKMLYRDFVHLDSICAERTVHLSVYLLCIFPFKINTLQTIIVRSQSWFFLPAILFHSLVLVVKMHPFTPSQWQELELQALIFHYMTWGIPIPSHLLHPFRSFFLDPFSLRLSMSYGRKVEEDPEPWRCKRTDGKKWRCSREAAGESKYCERHKHRGKRCLTRIPRMPMFTSPNYNTRSYSPAHLPLYSQPGDSRCHSLIDASSRYFHGHYKNGDEKERALAGGFSCEEKDRSLWFEAKEGDHCFVFGADLKLQKPTNVESKSREAQSPNVQLNFTDDSWMNSREYQDTRLSISCYQH